MPRTTIEIRDIHYESLSVSFNGSNFLLQGEMSDELRLKAASAAQSACAPRRAATTNRKAGLVLIF